MYLKKIEMQGFKSFADKTVITFEDSITAIVGPNGSGKSNVSDAIKWVLGEQSAKSLRGGKMEDVIFAGTDKRKQLGYSEVSITFDNSEKLIPIEFSEVEITRRMFRSGESEFYINKSPCRLRDIKELIMDTGIGKDGYSIIGQGRIEEILSDKPEDRRGIFEEAAGIVKYKTLKEESQRKLEKTELNLIRINDLFVEIEKQNKNLEKDSSKAVEYLKIFNELKKSQITVFINDINLHRSNLRKLEEDSKLKEVKSKEMGLEKERIEESLSLIKIELDELNINIDYKRELINDNSRKIDELKRNIDVSKEQKKYEELELTRLETEVTSLDSEVTIKRKLLAEKQETLNELEQSLELFNNTYKAKEDELELLLKNISEEESKLEEIKNMNSELFNLKIQVNGKISNIDSNKKNLENRINILNKDLKDIEMENNLVEKRLEELKSNNKIISEKIELLNINRLGYIEKLEINNEEVNNLKEELSNLKLELQKNISNYNIYKNMEEAYEGYYKSVKNLLLAVDTKKVSDIGFNGVVADLIKVKSGFEMAIETTLGSNLQNIVVDKDSDAKEYIDYLHKNKAGRVTFLPLNKISGNILNIEKIEKLEYGVLGLASDFVEYDDKHDQLMNYLLGRTVIVDSLNNGVKLSRKHNYRIVTLEGDIFNPGGSITGGSYGKNTLSIISRKNKVSELKSLIKTIQAEYNEKVDKLDSGIDDLRIIETDMKELLEKIELLDIEKLSYVDKINKDNVLISNSSLQLERLTNELFSLDKENKMLDDEKIDLLDSLKTHEKDEEIYSQNIDKKTKRFVELRNEYETKSTSFTSFRIDYNNSVNKIENIKNEIESLNTSLEGLKVSLNKSKDYKENVIVRINEINNKVAELDNNIKIMNEDLNKHTVEFDELITKSKKMLENRELLDSSLRVLIEDIYTLDRINDEISLNVSKEQMQVNNIEKELFVNYELDYEGAIKYQLVEFEINDLRILVEDLNKRIKKLGNVNVDSISEYKEINERYTFLLEQKTDLENSRDNLLGVIKDIEKEMEEKFIKSIKEINDNFQKIFKVLFNGGSAGLKIENEEEVLTSGIEIIAQPPGKKLQNIRLLSGGEKSLTAVALLFAILEIKPSPFCILDEIDAALDDANINRYTGYLKDLKEETQFILITHRKTTMEIADVLYGVTMEEEGVSKLYSLKMEDYID